jgi:hypothetical protein
MASGNFFGYETYMICEDGFCNVEQEGRVVGFQVQLRLANYRGYVLSQIEDICINVDGVAIEREQLRFTVGGNTYTLAEMEDTVDDRWELRQVATLTCLQDGGLTPGTHALSVEEHVRASYIPMTARAFSTRTLLLETDTRPACRASRKGCA